MPLIRLVLVLVTIGGLAALAVSNWSPVLSLVFLGWPTPPLPLAVWVLGAIAAGAATTLAFNTLFSLSNYWAVRQARPAAPKAATQGVRPGNRPGGLGSGAARSGAATRARGEDLGDEAWQNWQGYETPDRAKSTGAPSTGAPSASGRSPQSSPPDPPPTGDDWDWIAADDWDAKPRPAARGAGATSAPPEKPDPVRTPRPDPPDPVDQKRASPSQDRAKPISDRAKQVVDADYRVIVPPYKPPSEE
jgi:hypothetical protein